MQLDQALHNVTLIGIDTAPIIYFVEANLRYDALVSLIFQRISEGALVGLTSVVTLTEVLTRPKHMGDMQIESEYRSLLMTSRHFTLRPITAAIADTAADLRARYGLRTPDALQIATAWSAAVRHF